MNQQSPIVTVAASIGKVESLQDRTLKLTVYTSKELKAEDAAILFGMNQKLGYLAFKETPIAAAEMIDLPEIEMPEVSKSPAQRLRSVLFRVWEQGGKNGDFEAYYTTQMERFITAAKEKLA